MNTSTKPKKFTCENCNNSFYVDANLCKHCNSEGTIKPIAVDVYRCYLNGVLYGVGDLEYMNELFRDYVVTRKMYGKHVSEFKIVKDVDF